MRITNSMMLNSMMKNMGKNLSRMNKTEQMMATGKKFSVPSDDPIGVSRSLRLNTDVANMEQYKRNTEDALSWMTTTEIALENIGDILHRAKELAVQGATETYSVDQRSAIATEIEQLRKQLINVGNTTYAGSHIFAGYKTNAPLLAADGTYNTVTPLQSTEVIEFNIGISDRMGVNIPGQRIFGRSVAAGDIDNPVDGTSTVSSGEESQLLEVFDTLVFDLKADDTPGIRAAMTRLDAQFDNINALRAEVGVKANRLELTVNRIDDDTLNLKDLLSKNEDADMAEVIMNLQMQENVYKASLSGGAKIIQPSLIDFLR
jgi:flagellar hook-associated protein 3 FlgL